MRRHGSLLSDINAENFTLKTEDDAIIANNAGALSHWYTRWWLLLYVVLGSYAAFAIVSSTWLIRSSVQPHGQESYDQVANTDVIQVGTELRARMNSLRDLEKGQRADTEEGADLVFDNTKMPMPLEGSTTVITDSLDAQEILSDDNVSDTSDATESIGSLSDERQPPERHSNDLFSGVLPEIKPDGLNARVHQISHNLPDDEATLRSIIHNTASDQTLWSVDAQQTELDRLEAIKREANEETKRLKRLSSAANYLIDAENERQEEVRSANLTDILSHHPRKVRSNLQCMGWRQTGGCNSYGKRERGSDLKCKQTTLSGNSGYCEIKDNDTGEFFRAMQLNCTSLRTHVTFSCNMAADIANFGMSAQLIYEEAQQQNESNPSKLVGSSGHGNGIVIVVYPRLLPSVYASISALRSYNCNVPIELWMTHAEAVRYPKLKPTLEKYQQQIANVTVETITDIAIAGFASKIYAIRHSKFENVLFLDADSVPVRDPTFLFESQEFQEHGAVFWPDFWHPDCTIFNIQRESLLWQLVNLPFVDMFEQESGQILLNRRRAVFALEVLEFFSSHRPNYFDKLMLAHGDKDLFRLAWMKAQTSFYMMPFPPGIAGGERGSDKKRFCGMTMVQFDFDGNILFMHRNMRKLNGKDDLKFWTHVQMLKWEQDSEGEGESVSGNASRTAVQRMISYDDIKQKYRIGGLDVGPLFKDFPTCFSAKASVVDNFKVVRVEDFPFAMLEQQLIDYAREGSLMIS
ncbi:hypothetical protein CCR75_007353 [Bremia lactucae]|uniref:Nucleotide-diphospho-sugar transferase n=1 Tax=Bremia lactucae TaxID=4779 RepID=A0A976IBY4_BRELC|nr:hypothetical protein CCR75_005784 [Bremia lactucae]TDH71393.1 hypothetical protein CCR75_007353 [Bremia lactucae]